MDIEVRKYSLRPPIGWDASCDDQMRRMTALWNKLVEIDRAARAEYRAAVDSDTAAAAANAEVETLIEQRRDLIERRKTARKAGRAKVPTPGLDAGIEALAPMIADATARAKAARLAARDRVKTMTSAIEDRRRAAVVSARQAAAADGLWWGHYNAVLASYDRARIAAMKAGTDLRFHRHDGSGRLVNQIQGGMTVDKLLSGGHSQASIVTDSADGTGRATLTATVWARGREARKNVSWPVLLHRPLPGPDYLLKEVVVTRTRVGPDWEWAAVLTFTRPTPDTADSTPATADLPALAIDIGWRRLNDGIRVATVLRDGEARPRHIILPERNIDEAQRVADIASERDRAFQDVLPEVLAADWSGAPETVATHVDALRQAPKPSGRRLYSILRDAGMAGWHAPIIDVIRLWRDGPPRVHYRGDRRLWRESARLIRKSINRRRTQYRMAVASMLDGVGAVILDKIEVAKASRRRPEDGSEPEMHDAARAYARMAAPAELRGIIIHAAKKRGIPIVVDDERTTWECAECGTVIAPSAPDRLVQQCPHCSAVWDQDANACRVMLRRHRASGPVREVLP